MVLAKTWHFRNTQGICKQLNPLSLDQGLYLPDCRICDEAYSLQFSFFCPSTALSYLHWYKISIRSIHSLGWPFYSI
jgi:hypothetical protein